MSFLQLVELSDNERGALIGQGMEPLLLLMLTTYSSIRSAGRCTLSGSHMVVILDGGEIADNEMI